MRLENILIKFAGGLLFSYSVFYVIARKLDALTNCVMTNACSSQTAYFVSGYTSFYVVLAGVGLTLLASEFIKEK